MYKRAMHILPPTLAVDPKFQTILMSRGDLTLERMLSGPMSTKEIVPYIGSLCVYLRKLTNEAMRWKFRIKDASPRNIAYCSAGGLSPPQGLTPLNDGGVVPAGWAFIDFGAWVALEGQWLETWHAQNDVANRLKSSEEWKNHPGLFDALKKWLFSRPAENSADEALTFVCAQIAIAR